MIPPFDDRGYLPPGVHRATLAEIEARFGVESEVRRAQMDSLRWLIEQSVRVGIDRIVLNGSFVTDIIEPNDVDCALLVASDYPRDATAEAKLRMGLPYLQLELVELPEFERLVGAFFATDRDLVPKGMVEVAL